METKKKIKASQHSEKYDQYFDTTYSPSPSLTPSAELPYHKIPETASTPMADVVIDDEYNTEELTAPLKGACAARA